jgi:phosphatidylserine/phosphatidylglycerophosphate/cardiolipin synthase-like enzyme
VTVEAAVAKVVARLSDAQLAALATACDYLAAPSASLAASVAGAGPGTSEAVAALRAAWASTPGLTGAGVALALRTGLAARQRADQRRTRPVWTGPGAVGEQRLTAAVIHELLADARERILLVSYAAYTLPELAGDLRAAAERGCTVDVLFESEDDNAKYHGAKNQPFTGIPGLVRWRWPKELRPPGAALHAKLLVVDGCRALIGSANLTNMALSGNTEAGVMTADAMLASALERHVRDLMADGTYSRY